MSVPTSLRIGVLLGMLLLLLAMPGVARAASVTVDLCATPGTITVPASGSPGTLTVKTLGYALGPCAASTPAQVPGPAIVASVGDTVTVTLHNYLAENTAIWFQGQGLAPDLTGAAPGGTTTYTFTASTPGTYLYEAGLLPNAEHQAAMGMTGALIVNPATANQAYGDTDSAYAGQATMVLGEVDPALNNAANPATFDMRNYAPKYFLLNGAAYAPGAATIPVAAGTTELLRFVNGGVLPHSMALLGLHQQVLAIDGNRYTYGATPTPYAQTVVAQTIQPGQTSDVLATIPAAPGVRYALYDANLLLRNANVAGFGGMLAFLEAGTATVSGRPVTSNTALDPNPTNGSVNVAVTANVTSATALTGAELFIDSTGADGTGAAMSTSGCTTGDVCGTISATTIAGLSAGNHTIYVHAQNGVGWGDFDFAVLNVDTAGPASTSLVLSSNPTNGGIDVVLSGTATDAATGGSTIASAQYTIDGGGAQAMTVTPAAATVASIKATITAATIIGLSQGPHTLAVTSQDAFGNVGAPATITLNVDKTGPVASNVTATPNPTNGKIGVDANTNAVRVVASLADAFPSNIAAAEAFIDTVNANGTGIVMVPLDGSFSSSTEGARVDIPLTTINNLPTGNHTIYVHGKDAAGNWGTTSTTVLVVDKAAPTINSVALTPSTIAFGTASTTLSVSAVDADTSVTGGQYWLDGTATPPANATAFNGASATITTSSVAAGVHTLYVRVQDAAGNWSTVSNATLTVIQAVNDASTVTANGSATQTITVAAPGLLTNDQPIGVAGRTTALATQAIRLTGTGAGSLTAAVNANGSYTLTLVGVGNNNNQRAASKRGTFRFSYTMTLNGATSTATVTITVN